MDARHKFEVLAIALAMGLSGAASATDFAWTNSAGGTYSTAGNWDPSGGPPTSSDTVIFSNGGVYAVSFNADGASGKAVVTNNTAVTFNLNDGTARTWTIGTVGGLMLQGGTVTFTGAGTNSITGQDPVSVQGIYFPQPSFLIVSNGAYISYNKMYLASAGSTLTITDPGSTLKDTAGIADNGFWGAVFRVLNGGVYLPYGINGMTELLVSGTGSKLQATTSFIGNANLSANGIVITNGGRLQLGGRHDDAL